MGEVNLRRTQPQERAERPAVEYMSDSLRFGLTCSLNFYSSKLSEDIQSLVQAEVLFTGHKWDYFAKFLQSIPFFFF
jgi:hypothetical protein